VHHGPVSMPANSARGAGWSGQPMWPWHCRPACRGSHGSRRDPLREHPAQPLALGDVTVENAIGVDSVP
jgi:hypothetical protein